MTGEKMKRAINWWTKLSPTFLQVLGVIFLAGYAWPIINPNLSPALHSLCNWTLFVIWVFFAFDYFARLSIADDKRLFVMNLSYTVTKEEIQELFGKYG
jgi:hypothetical protein